MGWNAKDGEEARKRTERQQQQRQAQNPALATGASSAAPPTSAEGGKAVRLLLFCTAFVAKKTTQDMNKNKTRMLNALCD